MKDEHIYKKLAKLSKIIEINNFTNGIPVLGAIGKKWWLTKKEQGIFTDEFQYTKIIKTKEGFLPKKSFLQITPKGDLFLSNYDESKSKKIDAYLGKYPHITKLFYLLGGISIGLIPTVIIFFTK